MMKMTSKEALEELIENIKVKGKCDLPWTAWVVIRLNTIKKDLEALEVLKRSIFNKEIHKYVLNEKLKGQKFMTIGISIRGDTDINKIKEWLENDR